MPSRRDVALVLGGFSRKALSFQPEVDYGRRMPGAGQAALTFEHQPEQAGLVQ